MGPASNSSSSSSSRWSPTPDQVMILEEMYKVGIRTPNASQIQQITAHLSLYGKIEGKNVFYWFQNHKARDRQKLRRKLICNQAVQQVLLHGGSHHHHHASCRRHHHQLQPHIDQQLNVQHHNNINNSYSLVRYLNQPLNVGSDHQRLFCNPNELHNNQGGGGEHASTVEVMKNMRPWKAEVRQADDQKAAEIDKYSPISRSILHGHHDDHEYDNNWTRMMMMMMMDHVGPHHEYFPSCPYNYSTRPLKTLQLFPITTTKEECSMNLCNNVN